MKNAEKQVPLPVTDWGPKPGDFPIGSPESRAAACGSESSSGLPRNWENPSRIPLSSKQWRAFLDSVYTFLLGTLSGSRSLAR